jgi:hypothetical protein
MQLDVTDMSPRERLVFLASCRLGDTAPDGRAPVLHDPAYSGECERLAEVGWLERVEHAGKLVGYRLSPEARTASSVQDLIEDAQQSAN